MDTSSNSVRESTSVIRIPRGDTKTSILTSFFFLPPTTPPPIRLVILPPPAPPPFPPPSLTLDMATIFFTAAAVVPSPFGWSTITLPKYFKKKTSPSSTGFSTVDQFSSNFSCLCELDEEAEGRWRADRTPEEDEEEGAPRAPPLTTRRSASIFRSSSFRKLFSF